MHKSEFLYKLANATDDYARRARKGSEEAVQVALSHGLPATMRGRDGHPCRIADAIMVISQPNYYAPIRVMAAAEDAWRHFQGLSSLEVTELLTPKKEVA